MVGIVWLLLQWGSEEDYDGDDIEDDDVDLDLDENGAIGADSVYGAKIDDAVSLDVECCKMKVEVGRGGWMGSVMRMREGAVLSRR